MISDEHFIAGRSKQIETDVTGAAESTLVKGMLLDVIIEGTSIIRRIQVPTTGSEFDLLDPDLVLGDPFQIQVPDLPSAVSVVGLFGELEKVAASKWRAIMSRFNRGGIT